VFIDSSNEREIWEKREVGFSNQEEEEMKMGFVCDNIELVDINRLLIAEGRCQKGRTF
jgi:hypothetical protein